MANRHAKVLGGIGILRFANDLYEYMRPECKNVLAEWIGRGRLLDQQVSENRKLVTIQLQHPDFVIHDRQPLYRLLFKFERDVYRNRHPVIDRLEVFGTDNKWSIVKHYDDDSQPACQVDY